MSYTYFWKIEISYSDDNLRALRFKSPYTLQGPGYDSSKILDIVK